jgi:chromosome segregation ATPase
MANVTSLNIVLVILTLIMSFLTIRSTIRKNKADADHTEIDNVRELIKTWKEAADDFKQQLSQARCDYQEVSKQVQALTNEVEKLTKINNRILKVLDKITPDNLEKKIEEIKQLIHESNS